MEPSWGRYVTPQFQTNNTKGNINVANEKKNKACARTLRALERKKYKDVLSITPCIQFASLLARKKKGTGGTNARENASVYRLQTHTCEKVQQLCSTPAFSRKPNSRKAQYQKQKVSLLGRNKKTSLLKRNDAESEQNRYKWSFWICQ